MRIAIVAFCLALYAGNASAQTQTAPSQPGDSTHSTGRTTVPAEVKAVTPSQGTTGPTTGKGGGAPASSPQGETPPAMQAAPEGSDKTIVGPPK
jgi:hypothetical protein